MMLYCDQLPCPASFPWLFVNILATETQIVEVMFANTTITIRKNDLTELCKQQLIRYFAQELLVFELPIITQGTPFAAAVYAHLCKIASGQVNTYQDIARVLGDANKARAVGRACALNKLSILVPCHRVVSAKGGLTGYSGGLATKAWLLAHESSLTPHT